MAEPLGYYLTHIHTGLERNFAALLADRGLARRSWQILNTLAARPLDPSSLDRALAHFLGDAEPTLEPHLAQLGAHGWVRTDAAGRYTLTESGTTEHRTLAARIDAERAAVTDGLGEEGYATLIALLQRVSDNVDTIAATRH
ncbi:MarR family winged helix-turn-helix transcriptional regulator [Nocardia sp. NPDC127579]|uniref:MarR family winged helix-turn-helix transcriptional regulator n=1 Tax=Nocardia sp. NPDC127579 TaxID=3345402 RepID=UPI00362CDC5C